MTFDFSRCRLPPFAHQREDVAWLYDRSAAFIASQMRTGKTKIVIDTAQFLFEAGLIDKVVVVTPAPVRSVWYDPRLGELRKHLWKGTPHKIIEYHDTIRMWQSDTDSEVKPLEWIISNYEFLRRRMRLTQILPACGPRTLLVGDESSFLKNYASEQTKAFMSMRKLCGRVVLLNGTPIFHSPLDLFSQGNILSPKILDCPFVTQFKAQYAVQGPILTYGGKPLTKTVVRGKWSKEIIIQEITGWTNLEDLEARFKPYTVRRLQSDLADMPPKLDPVTLAAPLEPVTWHAYKEMRDNLVVWLTESTVATSATAAIRVLRLAQITGGFLGGVQAAGIEEPDTIDGELVTDPIAPGFLESLIIPGMSEPPPVLTNGNLFDGEILGDNDDSRGACSGDRHKDHGADLGLPVTHSLAGTPESSGSDVSGDRTGPHGGVAEGYYVGREELGENTCAIGREKLDVLLWFIEQQLESDPNLHLVAWSRFRAEIFRAVHEVQQKFPQFETAVLLGDQKKADRLRALELLKPETSPTGPVFVGGIEGTGSFGIDMTAAHTCVTLSSGYSPGRSAQTLDRVYGPGQKHPIAYYNIIATGPKGQKTIDTDILLARMTGEDIARRTTQSWVKTLLEE